MPLIDYTLDGRINKVDQAIQRIHMFDPIATGYMDTPYYVAYSGGKDSDVIRILNTLAGVKHELVHNHTTVDAPETVHYIRSIPGIIIDYPYDSDGHFLSMWRLIPKRLMPPTRLVRFCCDALKERGGRDRFVMTGVRWAESVNRRKKRGGVEVLTSDIKKKLILNVDNDDSRRMLENCQMKGKRIINPIIDWTDADVWEFLNYYNCESNPLYQEERRRIGCVGCPMGGKQQMEADFVRWPVYKENYIRAFDRMLQVRSERGLPQTWKSGEEVFIWWMHDRNRAKQIQGQEMLVDYQGGES